MALLRRLLNRRRPSAAPVPVAPDSPPVPDALDTLPPPAAPLSEEGAGTPLSVVEPEPDPSAPNVLDPCPPLTSFTTAGELVTLPLPARKKRSGSKKREREKKIYVRVTDEEYAAILAKAAAMGLPAGGYGRAQMLGAPTPGTRRKATPDRALLAEAIGALNRTGNNLNQIAKTLNRGEGTLPEALTAALHGYADALNRLMHAATGAAHDR